ncbi:AEC family transporter [Faecalibacterium sp. An122]|uniref:AEC family transporter n=1 Tax=Faecalibacterium sp. An122 TaxID=1965551 RepID=UPI000B372FE2|nr:AEC family transporter [Faecalibacterium sp. An122]OUQ32906.1 permease [Faecalibacterium sp. An122]
MNEGNLVAITAQQVLMMFLLILTGYLAVRGRLLNAEARQGFSSLLVNLVVPAMIINSYLIEFDPEILSNLVRTAFASAAVLVIGLCIALLSTRKKTGPDQPILRFAMTFSNAGYMGFPLINALFGAEGMLYASIFNTFFNLLIWTAGIALVDRSSDAAKRNLVVELIKKPALLAVAVGLVLYLGQIPVPYLIAQPISLLAGMNTPLSMLITGIIIATSDLWPVIRSFQLWHAILIRMLIIPAASFLFCLLTGTGGMVGAVVILLEACPCAALTSVLAIQYRYSEQLAAGLVVLSTLLSIVTLPLCAMFVQMMG